MKKNLFLMIFDSCILRSLGFSNFILDLRILLGMFGWIDCRSSKVLTFLNQNSKNTCGIFFKIRLANLGDVPVNSESSRDE